LIIPQYTVLQAKDKVKDKKFSPKDKVFSNGLIINGLDLALHKSLIFKGLKIVKNFLIDYQRVTTTTLQKEQNK
jgi:hypothetical protein